jgi:hypothetical protein
MLEAWLRSGRLIDLIVVGMLVETLLLFVYARRTGRGVPPAALLTNMTAGLALMLALRAALAGDPAHVPLWITVALCAHVGEVLARWRR